MQWIVVWVSVGMSLVSAYDSYLCGYRSFTMANLSLSMYISGADIFASPVDDFPTARANCQSFAVNTDLIEFSSQDLAAVVVDHYKTYYSTYSSSPWIGLIRNDTSSSTLTDGWIWVNGSAFNDPTFWASGQPNNEQGQEYCAVIDSSVQIRDENCDSYNAYKWYICEVKGKF
jgi:hypothetical protein